MLTKSTVHLMALAILEKLKEDKTKVFISDHSLLVKFAKTSDQCVVMSCSKTGLIINIEINTPNPNYSAATVSRHRYSPDPTLTETHRFVNLMFRFSPIYKTLAEIKKRHLSSVQDMAQMQMMKKLDDILGISSLSLENDVLKGDK